jgi:hypothetical protein
MQQCLIQTSESYLRQIAQSFARHPAPHPDPRLRVCGRRRVARQARAGRTQAEPAAPHQPVPLPAAAQLRRVALIVGRRGRRRGHGREGVGRFSVGCWAGSEQRQRRTLGTNSKSQLLCFGNRRHAPPPRGRIPEYYSDSGDAGNTSTAGTSMPRSSLPSAWACTARCTRSSRRARRRWDWGRTRRSSVLTTTKPGAENNKVSVWDAVSFFR